MSEDDHADDGAHQRHLVQPEARVGVQPAARRIEVVERWGDDVGSDEAP
jgi:hypothetical protein